MIPKRDAPEHPVHFRRFLELAAVILGTLEGGGAHTQYADDPGGETWWGISRRYRPEAFEDGRVTPGEAVDELWSDWLRVRGWTLPRPVDFVVLDEAWNGGWQRSAKRLQGLVGSVQDGLIGVKTLAAVDEAAPAELALRHIASRRAWIAGRGHAMEQGLLNRLVVLQREAGLTVAGG